MSNILSDLIDQQGWCVADGATGTNLFGRGLETGIHPNYGRLNVRMIFCGFMAVFLKPDQI